MNPICIQNIYIIILTKHILLTNCMHWYDNIHKRLCVYWTLKHVLTKKNILLAKTLWKCSQYFYNLTKMIGTVYLRNDLCVCSWIWTRALVQIPEQSQTLYYCKWTNMYMFYYYIIINGLCYNMIGWLNWKKCLLYHVHWLQGWELSLRKISAAIFGNF